MGNIDKNVGHARRLQILFCGFWSEVKNLAMTYSEFDLF